jgi:hypothetical protein
MLHDNNNNDNAKGFNLHDSESTLDELLDKLCNEQDQEYNTFFTEPASTFRSTRAALAKLAEEHARFLGLHEAIGKDPDLEVPWTILSYKARQRETVRRLVEESDRLRSISEPLLNRTDEISRFDGRAATPLRVVKQQSATEQRASATQLDDPFVSPRLLGKRTNAIGVDQHKPCVIPMQSRTNQHLRHARLSSGDLSTGDEDSASSPTVMPKARFAHSSHHTCGASLPKLQLDSVRDIIQPIDRPMAEIDKPARTERASKSNSKPGTTAFASRFRRSGVERANALLSSYSGEAWKRRGLISRVPITMPAFREPERALLNGNASGSYDTLPRSATKLPLYGKLAPSPPVPAFPRVKNFVANNEAPDSGHVDIGEAIVTDTCPEMGNIHRTMKNVVDTLKQMKEVETKSEEDIGLSRANEPDLVRRQESHSKGLDGRRILTDGLGGTVTTSPGKVSKLRARFENMDLYLD